MKIGIIGAGASGLAALRHSLEQGHECVVFEQTDKIGGTWNYTDYTHQDENGLPVHSSMYHGLKSNLPKDLMEFEDFFYDEKGKSFIDAGDVCEYIQKFAFKYKLLPHIKFLRQTILIEPLADEKWLLKERNLKSNEITEHVFDGIMVCSGHYSVPNIPNITGHKHFDRKSIHSHSYRKADPYKGKRVLFIGAGPSGVDISSIVAEVADRVYLSYGKTLFSSPNDTVIHKPLVDHFEKDKVIFQDGSEASIDNIVYCTGYLYEYSFLSPKSGITIENNWVKYIYKHIVNVEHPTMAFIGINFKICHFPAFDYQVRFFLEMLKGTIKVTKEEMMNDIFNDTNARKEKGLPKKLFHQIGMLNHQSYFDDLADAAKIKKARPVIHKLYKHVYNNRSTNKRYRVINDEEFIEVYD